MKALSDKAETVLVTGGSGFLGSWVVVTLLRQGFNVRTTVRNLAREADLRRMVVDEVEPGDRLSVYAADLLQDGGWAEAVDGADYVVHVASPMPAGEFRDQDILTPARDGTRRVLEAASAAGVRRVVLTSSGVAALPPIGETNPMTEALWTERPDTPAYRYARAKTLAEQDAWAFVRSDTSGLELTTILPGLIQGPVLGPDYSASIDLVAQMLQGKMPAVPRIGFGVVDVRDLAELHVRAMLSPAAGGERFLAIGEFVWLIAFAAVLRDEFGVQAAKAPTRVMPDWLVRVMAMISKEMASTLPDLGVERVADASKALRVLDWETRPAAQSIADTAASLLARKLV